MAAVMQEPLPAAATSVPASLPAPGPSSEILARAWFSTTAQACKRLGAVLGELSVMFQGIAEKGKPGRKRRSDHGEPRPKRPPTAYSKYVGERVKVLKPLHPGLSAKEVFSMAAKDWQKGKLENGHIAASSVDMPVLATPLDGKPVELAAIIVEDAKPGADKADEEVAKRKLKKKDKLAKAAGEGAGLLAVAAPLPLTGAGEGAEKVEKKKRKSKEEKAAALDATNATKKKLKKPAA